MTKWREQIASSYKKFQLPLLITCNRLKTSLEVEHTLFWLILLAAPKISWFKNSKINFVIKIRKLKKRLRNLKRKLKKESIRNLKWLFIIVKQGQRLQIWFPRMQLWLWSTKLWQSTNTTNFMSILSSKNGQKRFNLNKASSKCLML